MASFLNGLHSLMIDDDEDVSLPPPSQKPTPQKEKSATQKSKVENKSLDPVMNDDSDDFMFFNTSNSNASKRKRNPEDTWFDEDDNMSLQDMMKSLKDDDISDDFILDDDFDALFDPNNDDIALENNLIAQGRAYARKNGVDPELGEIEKAFAPQQKALRDLIADIDTDSKGVQRDIDGLRMSRTRNTKSLADLVSAKGSLTNIRLSAIKELSSIQKTIIDTNMKLKASDKMNAVGDDSEAAFAVQKLLSSSNIMDSVGGLTGVSGAFHDGENPNSHNSTMGYLQSDDDEMEAKYANEEDTEGDKYIKYENSGVKLHLQVYPDGGQAVVAIDKDGNEVPDYPLPPNVENLKFNIHDDLGTASDHANREYILDRIGSDDSSN